MPRKGRELEILVEKLERVLTGENIKIKSPDYVIDQVTGESREIDISIKGKIGTYEIFIILEVRDWVKKQDAMWIEQIATKRQNVGANKVIAISSSGFTKGAKEMAKAYNIELRTLETVNSKIIKDWFLPESMKSIIKKFDIRSVTFNDESLNEGDLKRLEDFISSYNGEIPKKLNFILDAGMTEPICLDNLLLSADLSELYESIPLDCKKRNLEITLVPQNQDFGFQIITDKDSEPIKIKSIFIGAILYIEHIVSPIQYVKEYRSSDQAHAEVVNFGEIEISGEKRSIEMYRFVEGDTQRLAMSFDKKE